MKVHRLRLPGRSLCSIRSNRKWCKRRGSSLQCQNCFFVYPIIDCNLKNLFNSVISYGWNNYIIFHIASTSFLSFRLSFGFQFSDTVPHTRGLPLVRAGSASRGIRNRRRIITPPVRFLYHHLFKGIVGKQGHRVSSSVSSSSEVSPVSASGSSSS